MKDYYNEIKRLIDYRDKLINERKEATERVDQINEEIKELKKSMGDPTIRNKIEMLEEEKNNNMKVLKKDISLLLFQEYNKEKLNELEKKAKSEYNKQLTEKRKEFNKANELYKRTRNELHKLTEHNIYKESRRLLSAYERTMERFSKMI